MLAAGFVIAALVYSGSIFVEKTCNRQHAKKLKDISNKLEEVVNRYTESQKKMFDVLGHSGAFDAGQSFAVNLKLIKDIVEKAEMEAETFFPNIDEVISRVRSHRFFPLFLSAYTCVNIYGILSAALIFPQIFAQIFAVHIFALFLPHKLAQIVKLA